MSITLALPHFNNKSYMLTESGCQNKFEVPLLQPMLLDSNTKTEHRVNNNSLISIPIRSFYPYFSFFLCLCVCNSDIRLKALQLHGVHQVPNTEFPPVFWNTPPVIEALLIETGVQS